MLSHFLQTASSVLTDRITSLLFSSFNLPFDNILCDLRPVAVIQSHLSSKCKVLSRDIVDVFTFSHFMFIISFFVIYFSCF